MGPLGGSVGWVSNFHSGHDLTAREFEPYVRLCADSSEPGVCFGFSVPPSLCSSLAHALSPFLSRIDKTLKNLKRKEILAHVYKTMYKRCPSFLMLIKWKINKSKVVNKWIMVQVREIYNKSYKNQICTHWKNLKNSEIHKEKDLSVFLDPGISQCSYPIIFPVWLFCGHLDS